jgi:hypothetical protein
MDIQCLQCGRSFAAEPTAPARCPYCGWRRKAPDPWVGAPAGENSANEISFGCLIAVLLLAVGFLLFLMLECAGAPWGTE